MAGATGTIITCPLEVIKTRFQSSTSSYKRIIEQKSETTKNSTSVIKNVSLANNNLNASHISNLNNRIKALTSRAYACPINSTIVFRSNHIVQHQTSLMASNGFNFNLDAATQQNFKCLNTSSKSVQPKPGLGIYLHFK